MTTPDPSESQPPGSSPPLPARRSQRERRDASRCAILAAARAEFLEHGYAKVSLEDIVSRAGLTRGALYHQFDDKAAVLEAVVQYEAASMQDRMRPAMVGIDHPLERLRVGFSIYLDAIDDVRMLRLIHVEYPAYCGPARATIGSAWLTYVEAAVAESIAKGFLRPVDVRSMSRLILAFYRESLVAIAYAEDRRTMRADMAAALDAIMDGLRTDRAPCP